MTVKERVLSLRLLQRQQKDPEYANKLGVNILMVKKRNAKIEK